MLAPASTETELRELTWEYCGISRNRSGLEAAIHLLDRTIWENMDEPSLPKIELRNMQEVAALIARAALWREESRGAHFRADFPEKHDEFLRPSTIVKQPIVKRLPAESR
jgi:aspartate oxidase